MDPIIAVTTSWNPDVETLREMVRIIQKDIQSVIISDNDSRLDIKKQLVSLQKEFPDFISIIWNSENLGVAAGLNRGVAEGLRRGARWIMTLDQDSVPDNQMLPLMFGAYEALPPDIQSTIGMMAPNYTTLGGFAFPFGKARITSDGAITSGAIVKAETFATVGVYDEALFIDYVDGEFSLRLSMRGIKTLSVPDAILHHALGHPVSRRFLWKTATVPNYPPYRYYYMARNSVYLYIRHFGTYILRNKYWYHAFWAVIVPRYFIKAIIFEDHKKEKIRMVARGAWDGLQGKMGRLK